MPLGQFFITVLIILNAFSISAASKILLFSANTNEIRTDFNNSWDEVLTFTAIVSDSQGNENIVGGALIDPLTKLTYGAFQAGTEKGAFSLSLTIKQINVVRNFDPYNPLRVFLARFYNNSGEVTESEYTIKWSSKGNLDQLTRINIEEAIIPYLRSDRNYTNQFSFPAHTQIENDLIEGSVKYAESLFASYTVLPKDESSFEAAVAVGNTEQICSKHGLLRIDAQNRTFTNFFVKDSPFSCETITKSLFSFCLQKGRNIEVNHDVKRTRHVSRLICKNVDLLVFTSSNNHIYYSY